MPYSSPDSSRVTGYVPSAANWNELAADLKWLAEEAPTCRVYKATDTSIANNTPTALSFTSERFDIGGMHSTLTDPSRITIPSGAGGIYRIWANVTFDVNATGLRTVAFQVNGSTMIGGDSRPGTASGSSIVNASVDALLAAGDYVECVVRQTSGGALDATHVGDHSPEFGATWMRF